MLKWCLYYLDLAMVVEEGAAAIWPVQNRGKNKMKNDAFKQKHQRIAG